LAKNGQDIAKSDGALFSDYFLTEGVALTSQWQALDHDALAAARAALAPLLADFETRTAPSEGNTERDLIDKILPLLGWDHFTVQEKANDKGRLDVPDYLLYLTPEAKQAATRAKAATERYSQGTAILEAKAWDLPLDKGEAGSSGAPSTQLLRYLGTVDVATSGSIRFGILTNGHLWRQNVLCT
jgi:hypothetical protein